MINYCVSICCDDLESTIEKLKGLEPVKFVEIRIDKFREFDLEPLRQFNIKKFILTFRSTSNGGFFRGSEQERIKVLKDLLGFGFGYIDIEYDIPKKDLNWFLKNKSVTKIIISYHNFEETPDNLNQICDKILTLKPDLLKIVTTAKDFDDNKKIFNVIDEYKNVTKLVAHAMGENGEISRILGSLKGNQFTYASIYDETTAPGQLSIQNLKQEYKLDRLKKNFKIYGLLGNPIKHSFGYIIHNFAFEASKMNALYLNFPAENVKAFIDTYFEMFSGLSVTIPFKQEIIPFLDYIDINAEIIGAVNTVTRKRDKLYGSNTDYTGFIESLKKYVNPRKKRIVILGSGGSARAVLVSLLEKNNDITILNRTVENAKKLAEEFNCSYGDLNDFKNHAPQILINCTPIGMYPNIDESPVNLSKLRNCIVYDLVYNPYYTKFLADASKNGNTIVSGFEMFLRQAQEQFILFTGKNFSYLKYRNYFLKQLNIL